MPELFRLSKSIRITVVEGDQTVFEKEFSHWPISFGRNSKMDVPLDYTFVSRTHCLLVEENGKFCLTDLQSSNGVTVDGKQIQKIELNDHLDFQIGTLQISIRVLIPLPREATASIVIGDQSAKTVSVPQPEFQMAPISEHSNSLVLELEKPPLKSNIRFNTALPKNMKPPHIPEHPQPPQHVQHSPPPPLPRHGPVAAPPVPERAPLGPPQQVRPASHAGHAVFGRKPMIERNVLSEMMTMHPGVAQARVKRVEAVVTWYDQVYAINEFCAGDTITVGPHPYSTLPLPIMKESWALALVDSDKAKCYIPMGRQIQLSRGQQEVAMGDLLSSRVLTQSEFGYSLKINPHDVAHVDFGSGMKVHLRFVPASKRLTHKKMVEPDEALKQSLIGSTVLHAVLLMIMIISAPAQRVGPKLKNVPERFARLLVEKPKPKPTPAPTPPPLKKEIVKKPPEPRKVVQKKIMKVPKVVAKRNKFPMVVEHPIPKAPPPVKVETLGAMAALGAISKTASNMITNININKDAGGLPTKNINTGGIVGALPSSHGMLAAGGGPRVKTKGMGYGTGTGYGIQGLKGTAGGRGIAGAIVGQPKLAAISKIEGLTRAQVMAVVQKMLGEVQHCYERNLLANPSLAGRMEFEWDITPGGAVSDVRVKRSTVNGGDNLGECVKGLFISLRFPKATNGQTTTPSIGFPFGRL